MINAASRQRGTWVGINSQSAIELTIKLTIQ
jgi:hypothetical protein